MGARQPARARIHPRRSLTLLLGELAFGLVVAIPLGCALGYLLSWAIVAMSHTDMIAIPVIVAPRTYAFAALAIVLAGAASALIVLRAPKQTGSAVPPNWREQLQGLARIAADRWFWRLALLAASTQAAALSLLGLWAGPWLRDIAELSRAETAQHLLVAA